jgi:hypothetical protein
MEIIPGMIKAKTVRRSVLYSPKVTPAAAEINRNPPRTNKREPIFLIVVRRVCQ